MIDEGNTLWYQDAIIYQLHVKAFFDSNNDGVGDFDGLIRKLDYIKDLGVTAVWLLPFYPSPLRDDGYDISDYRNIQRSYGTMAEFKKLIKAAHSRDLRVITELVINHTSDQHPWFQRARRSRPGSVSRDYYVWSDTDQKYANTRIIFTDTENSNWAWDDQAQSFYWHRFYSHQPDLNFDNPRVVEEVLRLLRYWLALGVDGLRLDAVPYLCEREGTNNENLPETHAVLRRIRNEVDRHFPGRMLLAEANQWPEDTQEYFGKGDECHMAFHFPLMPRMYMAIAQEDRHPITDIMRQTPDIPSSCQWAVFLRNHDEMTLEMVTDEERDYLWEHYASDRRMRLNFGIRRRLAPLLERDRRKIQLMNGLLLSMPGTPVLYYGDEIGMGDNIYLGDRDGVRTPMQWSMDRNGGFSLADPAKLYLPPIMDPLYGYQTVNVEAQLRDASSLLHWMRRLVGTRKLYRSFGRGSLRFLYPGNRHILAFLRELDDEVILCVANLSRTAQAVELELTEFSRRIPIELAGRSAFPPIGELPYLLTLGPYEFFWFALSSEADMPLWHVSGPTVMPELPTLVMRNEEPGSMDARERQRLEQEVLPKYIPNQRWFAGKNATIAQTRIISSAEIGEGKEKFLMTQIAVRFRDGGEQHYQLPLAIDWRRESYAPSSPVLPFTLAKVRKNRSVGVLFDAMQTDSFATEILRQIKSGGTVPTDDGVIRFQAAPRLADLIPTAASSSVRRFSVEQSNSSVVIGDQAVLKLYRRLTPGTHPEIEMAEFLTEVAGYAHTPPLLGSVIHAAKDGTETALAILQGMAFNQGDGWTYSLGYLDRFLERAVELSDVGEAHTDAEHGRHDSFSHQVELLGRRTAELHRALLTDTGNTAFTVEPTRETDVRDWRRDAKKNARQAFASLRTLQKSTSGEPEKEILSRLLGRRAECLARIDAIADDPVTAIRSRIHGDFHLGQVLVVQNDFFIVDFEGEPGKPLAERRRKGLAIRDVAGMMRSIDYASHVAAQAAITRIPHHEDEIRTETARWRDSVSCVFLKSYIEAIDDERVWPLANGQADRLLAFFMLDKALYEIAYEAANRPGWIHVPAKGVLDILDGVLPVGGLT